MHDPAVFMEPDCFYPKHWLFPGAPTFPNQAFSFGARQCPGHFFACANMWSNIVGILATFDIAPVTLPLNVNLDVGSWTGVQYNLAAMSIHGLLLVT